MLREILREFSQNHMKILSGSCLKYFVYDLFAKWCPVFCYIPCPPAQCTVSVVSSLHKNYMRRKDWKVKKVKFPSFPILWFCVGISGCYFFFPADAEMQVQQNNIIKWVYPKVMWLEMPESQSRWPRLPWNLKTDSQKTVAQYLVCLIGHRSLLTSCNQLYHRHGWRQHLVAAYGSTSMMQHQSLSRT